MKRKGIIVTTCVVMLGLMAVGAGAHAGGKFGHRFGGPGGSEHGRILRAIIDTKLDMVAEELQLSDAQRAQVTEIRDRIWSEVKGGQGERGALRERFLEEFRKDTLRPEVLDELARDREARHDQVKQSLRQAIVDVHALLTPEQRGKLAGMIEEHCAARGLE